jgi:hypothetical protein
MPAFRETLSERQQKSDEMLRRRWPSSAAQRHLSAEDLQALTPLFHGHINPYGVRHFLETA